MEGRKQFCVSVFSFSDYLRRLAVPQSFKGSVSTSLPDCRGAEITDKQHCVQSKDLNSGPHACIAST